MNAAKPAKKASPCYGLVAGLERRWQRKDRALLARLRRGAGHGFGERESTRALFALLETDRHYTDWELDDLHLIATLFALHPCKSEKNEAGRRDNLGVTLRSVQATERQAVRAEPGDEVQSAAQRQLDQLLVSDREDLPWHLRRTATLAESHDVPVDYIALWWDIRAWTRDDHRVQRGWAAAFYNAPRPPSDKTREERSK